MSELIKRGRREARLHRGTIIGDLTDRVEELEELCLSIEDNAEAEQRELDLVNRVEALELGIKRMCNVNPPTMGEVKRIGEKALGRRVLLIHDL